MFPDSFRALIKGHLAHGKGPVQKDILQAK